MSISKRMSKWSKTSPDWSPDLHRPENGTIISWWACDAARLLLLLALVGAKNDDGVPGGGDCSSPGVVLQRAPWQKLSVSNWPRKWNIYTIHLLPTYVCLAPAKISNQSVIDWLQPNHWTGLWWVGPSQIYHPDFHGVSRKDVTIPVFHLAAAKSSFKEI